MDMLFLDRSLVSGVVCSLFIRYASSAPVRPDRVWTESTSSEEAEHGKADVQWVARITETYDRESRDRMK
jgi:hypothetical protein